MSSIVDKYGIILSHSDKQLDYALNLIATLRFQKNKLPSQVVEKEIDFKPDNMKLLHKVTTNTDVELPETKLDETKYAIPQTLFFLDITKTLNHSAIDSYTFFKNKWLATMFNLFEEFSLLGIGVINYVDLNSYFKVEKYDQYCTVYFRDRM